MSEHKISWGKVAVGAAVAAGAVAAFVVAGPAIEDKLIPFIQEIAVAAGKGIAVAWEWIGQNVIGSFKAGTGLVGLMAAHPTTAVSAAAVAGGIVAVESQAQKLAPLTIPADNSHTAREAIRKMESAMIARMRGAGYTPATGYGRN